MQLPHPPPVTGTALDLSSPNQEPQRERVGRCRAWTGFPAIPGLMGPPVSSPVFASSPWGRGRSAASRWGSATLLSEPQGLLVADITENLSRAGLAQEMCMSTSCSAQYPQKKRGWGFVLSLGRGPGGPRSASLGPRRACTAHGARQLNLEVASSWRPPPGAL